ncbi:MAG: aldehyde dehydrogenase family protein, partial [Coxiellaceae bacterium]|nr:aldehyde dehydrogenase family protein [Coxiellaceae bacterium]
LQHICNDVMAENNLSGIFSVIISNNDAVKKAFVEDKRLPLISFTGSSAVGQKINQVVAKRMGRCLLECSGNNAVIVDETADLNLAVPAIVFGAIGTAGQRCTSTRRVIVHHRIEKTLINALVDAYQKIKIGDPLDTKNSMGPLIDAEAVDDYQNAIRTLIKKRAEIMVGGNVMKRPGYFVEPTIVKAQNDWSIVQEETFAPILYVMSYQQLDDAIALQNGVCQGLSSSLFTTNLKTAEQFLSAQGSDCGIANVNLGTSGAEIGGAFGGEKATGGGREAGSDAWKAYMRRQTNTINWSDKLPLAQGILFKVR